MTTNKVEPLIPDASTVPDPIADALAKIKQDPGAVFEPHVLALLKQVRESEPARWARIRHAIKEAKTVSLAELDKLTSSTIETASGTDELFPAVTPWPEPVSGAELLEDLVAVIRRHVIADPPTIHAAALWAAFTWLIDAVQVAPIANITAPEKRCGKTVMLSVLAKLAYRPMQASGIATAALFRSIDMFAPTFFIDEVDAFLRDNEEARGILNAGFTRDSAFVIRCVGDDHMPTKFKVWGAKALCGIGRIAETLADRSIPLRLRRKKPGESVERLRYSDPVMWDRLRSRIARFADDNAIAIGAARPAEIEGLNDRANDCWEPLLAIAGIAGGDWPRIARQSAIALHGIEEESPSVGAELLGDIKAVFDEKRTTKVFSADLLAALVADDELPWATWNRGKPMSPRQLSSKLTEFGIKSGTVRQGFDTKKGYSIEQFRDAFARYLSGNPSSTSVTPSQASAGAASSVSQSVTTSSSVTHKKRLKAPSGVGCDDVTDETPLQPKGKGNAEYF